VCGTFGSLKRSACSFRLEASHRDPGNHKLMSGSRCWWEECRVQICEHVLRLVEAPNENKTPDFEIPRMRGVQPVAALLERRARVAKRLRSPAQIARDESNLGFGDDAPRAGYGFLRTEGASSTPQENLRSHEIAELCHRDAAQCERRRIVAQCDSFQCAERITRRQSARRGRDQ
jgi:hypothetical protein